MSHLYYNTGDYQMTIANADDLNFLGDRCAYLASTGGYGSQCGYICPVCGKWHTDGQDMCDKCQRDFYEDTIFGRIVKGKLATYKGNSVPASMLKNGKPTQAFNAYIALKRICSNFSL